MLVVAAQRFVAARLELAENQAVAALLASPAGKLLVAAGFILWHSGRNLCLKTAWSTAVAYTKRQRK
jgi:hypothetical protein